MAALGWGRETRSGLDPVEGVCDQQIVQGATLQLLQHTRFRYHLESVAVESHDGRLLLRGQLSSFYLKQVLQTTLRDLPGVK